MTIGIDLGTTNSCAAYMDKDGKVQVIPEEWGHTMASAISLSGNKFIIGSSARERAMKTPENTVISAKRLIGRPWYEAKNIAAEYGMEIVRGPENEPLIVIDNKPYSIPQVSGEILTAIKINAEKHLGCKVDSAVITVPAYFNDAQRDATRRAGSFAQLDVKAIISEPTAAALAYEGDGLIAVYDLGGGTFDISIVKKTNGKAETIATGGDLHLGGDDVDSALMKIFVRKVEAASGIKIMGKNNEAFGHEQLIIMQRIRNEAEKLKIQLSKKENVELKEVSRVLKNLIPGNLAFAEWKMTLTRTMLDNAFEKLADRTIKCCRNTLEEAGIAAEDLDAVILVGGSTKSEYIRQRVRQAFGKEPDTSLNPDESVAIGAAKSIELSENEAFVDVTPLELFMETKNGGTTLIPRHSQLPATVCKRFTTSNKKDTSMQLIIRQGSRKQSVRLATLYMTDLGKTSDGRSYVDVAFSISESGLMSVRALDTATGKSRRLTIKHSFG